MPVCINYSRPTSSSNDNEVYGFDVAVTNFLSAYFRYSTATQFICRPTDMPSFDHFKAIAAAAGIDANNACIGLDPRHPEKNLRSISCMFRPDPLTVDLIWRRQQMRGRGFATCGLVHTMSGERIARAVGDLCIAPSDKTDALICPSVAIRDAVKNLWDIYTDYLNNRFGGNFSCPVQTPIIPLGIDSEKMATRVTPQKRSAQRHILGILDDEIVILFVGRLSFATKAHPLPMFKAAERAAEITGRKIRLILFGYFKPKDMETHFYNLARDICKSVIVDFIMNDDPRFPDGIWAAADIFTSLSDNIQESFGLTPIEAMACGLPAVISDWDGYRDGVRNGSEGFLVPTITPPASAGMALAQFYYNEENYGLALAGTVQSTSVDIEWCTKSYAVLIDDADKRRQYGDNGRKRARDVFDWRHIIRAYDELWNSLSEQRQAAPPTITCPDNWQAMHPAYPNPWQMFKSFPTMQLMGTDIIHSTHNQSEIDHILNHDMNIFLSDLLLPRGQLLELIAIIRHAGNVRIENILAPFPTDRHDLLLRCVGWMLKNGLCSLERQR